MTHIFAITNQKGGVGKTTCAINIAFGWSRLLPESRVLLLDADPQANSTGFVLGMAAATGPRRAGVGMLLDVLLAQMPASQVIQRVEVTGNRAFSAATVDILPSHLQLAEVEAQLMGEFQRENRLKQVLEPIRHDYDVIIIDCPPSLGLLTINALVAASEVVIPVEPGVFPLVGIRYLYSTIKKIQQANRRLRIAGIIPMMIERTVLSRETVEQLQADYGDLLLPAVPRRVAMGEALAAGEDIFAYQPQGACARAFAGIVEALQG